MSSSKIISAICITYSLLTIVWLCFRWLFFDQIWLFAIINTTIFYFFLPLPFLILLALYHRSKWAIGVLLLPISVFLFFWGALFLPSLYSPAKNPTQELKAMSYNVLFSNETPDALATSIISASPDIVGFQELTPQIKNSLAASLIDSYPYHTFDMFGSQGVGLLSKYPILSANQFSFPPNDDRALHVTLDWQSQPVHVFVVHLSANNFFDNPISQLPQLANERYEQRANQITRLEEELGVIEEPIILMCDCNLTDSSEAYFRLNRLLNDSFHAAGWGFGHTLHPHDSPFRLQRIDYIWHSENFISRNSYVGKAGGSDHHPVISTFQYNEEK